MISVADVGMEALQSLLEPYGLVCEAVGERRPIPGSYWGESEAGLRGSSLLLRPDTPVHSALHESCHFICMDAARRAAVERDAGGDTDEENAVCYLQIVLADYLPAMSRVRMWRDMDSWGYTFRLGSARRWFEEDADDARAWLMAEKVLTATGLPTWRRREA